MSEPVIDPRDERVVREPVVERPVEPVVAPPVVEQHVVETTPSYAGSVAVVEQRVWFSPATVLGVLAGAFLIILGVVALVRGDLKGSINDPVVSVAGWDHTPLLGLIEIAAGLALVLSSFAAGAEMFFGAAVAVFGIIALIEPKVLSDNLEIASSLAWVFIALGAIPFIAAVIATMPRTRMRQRTTTTVGRVHHI